MAVPTNPPIRSLMAIFAVKGAFVPSAIHVTTAALNCSGVLALPGGARRKVILTVERRTPASHGMRMTHRLSYGCGPARKADEGAAFYRAIGDAVAPVIAVIVRREPRIVALWPRAARAHAAAPSSLDIPEQSMGASLSTAVVAAAWKSRVPVLDIGIHLRSGCLQRCSFCRHEPQHFAAAAHEGDLATVKDIVHRVVRPAARRGIDLRFRLEADDLAGHGRLAEIAALVSRETAFGLHLVIPPNRLADPAVARRIAALPGLESVTLTLFGCTPPTHDAVAGRPGAFHELLRASANLHAAGTVPLVLSAVLSAACVGELGGILDAAQLLRGRLIVSALFADCSMHHPRLAAIVPDLEALRTAFAREERRIFDLGVRLQDFPVCAVPPALRQLNDTNHVMQRNDYPALPACAPCVHRPGCPGVPRGYLDAHGNAHLAPEKPPRHAHGRRRRPVAKR